MGPGKRTGGGGLSHVLELRGLEEEAGVGQGHPLPLVARAAEEPAAGGRGRPATDGVTRGCGAIPAPSKRAAGGDGRRPGHSLFPRGPARFRGAVGVPSAAGRPVGTRARVKERG